ncbi:hypothetical protein K9N68_22715 [Kovacikia minuta CCNUW1]|uniref:hypothetical protein n=1 Tax=Kovacikia minuta TaxID=2931930 RepID=UPI001CCD8068|nr:hypothetical protein [Kovacikia minuta]UBF24484.1 hypothetical protein K9N68_22715 [Kovacikia minuta CCNUW1]
MKPNTPADVGFRRLNPTYKSRCYLILVPYYGRSIRLNGMRAITKFLIRVLR